MNRAVVSGIVAVLVACVPASGLPGLGSLRSSAAHSPAYPTPGQTVTFTVTASDVDAVVSNVVICFGDGSCDAETYSWTAQERTNACIFGSNYSARFTHAYARTGLFPVTLTVEVVGCPWAPKERQSSQYDLRVG